MKPPAALLFHGGTIWTGTGMDTGALLVSDGHIAALGADAHRRASAARPLAVDLQGGFLMPSFADGHAHPLFGGLEASGPQVKDAASVAAIVDAVRRYAEEHPGDDWIVGGSYDRTLAPGGLFDARWLDEAVAERPVVLRAADYHTLWCNSEALRRCGIHAGIADPALGEIPRRPDGSVLGTLREWGAAELVAAVMPPRDIEVGITALETAAAYYLAHGVTWVQDAWITPDDVDTYVAAVRQGRLGLRVNLAFYADPLRYADQLDGFVEARQRVSALRSPLLTAHTVKFFADGVVGNETAGLLRPYCSAMHSHGMRVWPGDSLAQAARAVDERGFQLHVHAIGDAAIRQALDAVEFTAAANGPRDRRPVIAHAELIDDADLARFAELGVVAAMQPLWAQLDDLMTTVMLPRLGDERITRMYRMGSLLRSGADLSFGSDWPVSSGAPLDGIAIALSRPAQAERGAVWEPGEVLTAEQALSAYTSAVARQAFAAETGTPWGAIVPGACADLVWLDRDPRAVPAGEIPGIAVHATYLAGVRCAPAPR